MLFKNIGSGFLSPFTFKSRYWNFLSINRIDCGMIFFSNSLIIFIKNFYFVCSRQILCFVIVAVVSNFLSNIIDRKQVIATKKV